MPGWCPPTRLGRSGRFLTKIIAQAPTALLMLGCSVGLALAQSPVCGQIRAELAQLGNTAGAAPNRDSTRLRAELGRIRLAIQQNDCNRSGFLGFNAPPAVCAPLRAQASQYEAQIRQIEGGGAVNNPRRAQLVAALDRYGCLGPPQQPQRGVIYATPGEPSLFERLFGDERPVDRRGADGMPIDPDGEPRERLGGRMAVCVRTCDGFYFPVNFEGIGARDEYGQVCQSLCPAAETQVFFMPLGAEIDRAATRDGRPYMSLAAAKKFQQARDPACFCKQPGQTWSSAMKGIEDLVETRKGDIVVTEEQALAMSRPKGAQTTDRKGKKPEPPKTANAAAPKPAEPEQPPSLPESALPTGGTASSGIGPKAVRERMVTTEGGTRQQSIGADGVRRSVRNVAPELTGKERPIDLRGATPP